ncbi:MAG: hypothetical protein DMF89_26170 [Acidobacteria bacterium]|nr:MAG: hypothetical protein DMF89_26170 [Acidobacteriota bacterium]
MARRALTVGGDVGTTSVVATTIISSRMTSVYCDLRQGGLPRVEPCWRARVQDGEIQRDAKGGEPFVPLGIRWENAADGRRLSSGRR